MRSLLTLASNSPEGDDGDEGAAARTVSPALSSTSPSVNSPAKHVQTFLDVRFHTPYLKGRATHFQRKVASKIEALTHDQPPPQPQPVQKKAKTLRTRKTNGQKNIDWRNDIIYAKDTGVRYANARKEATQRFADIKAGRVVDCRTQIQIIDDLNQKYGLDGAGREGYREKHMLSVRTVQHLVMNGQIASSPIKRGKKPVISRNLMRLIALHVSMEQVGDSGELSTAQIKATISAAMMDTVHDKDHNLDYVWQEIRRTAVSAVMDELFRAFKIAFTQATHKHFARKIKTQAQMIRRRKLEIAKRIANGEAVSAADQDRAKVKSVVSLNAFDLGPILYGQLTDDGFAADDSPIATCFTKEKIMAAYKKVCIAAARGEL